MTINHIHATIDCSEYDCPMVLVQVKEYLDRLASGEIVEVITDRDPKFQLVLQGWASETHDSYFDSFSKDRKTHHYIKKAKIALRKEPRAYLHVITNDELIKKQFDGTPLHILDVREDFEFMLGHVPVAVNVPLSQFTANLAGFDKEAVYYVICRTGNRSDMACKYMEAMGFQRVYNVLPGMNEWDGPVEED